MGAPAPSCKLVTADQVGGTSNIYQRVGRPLHVVSCSDLNLSRESCFELGYATSVLKWHL